MPARWPVLSLTGTHQPPYEAADAAPSRADAIHFHSPRGAPKSVFEWPQPSVSNPRLVRAMDDEPSSTGIMQEDATTNPFGVALLGAARIRADGWNMLRLLPPHGFEEANFVDDIPGAFPYPCEVAP